MHYNVLQVMADTDYETVYFTISLVKMFGSDRQSYNCNAVVIIAMMELVQYGIFNSSGKWQATKSEKFLHRR